MYFILIFWHDGRLNSHGVAIPQYATVRFGAGSVFYNGIAILAINTPPTPPHEVYRHLCVIIMLCLSHVVSGISYTRFFRTVPVLYLPISLNVINVPDQSNHQHIVMYGYISHNNITWPCVQVVLSSSGTSGSRSRSTQQHSRIQLS